MPSTETIFLGDSAAEHQDTAARKTKPKRNWVLVIVKACLGEWAGLKLFLAVPYRKTACFASSAPLYCILPSQRVSLSPQRGEGLGVRGEQLGSGWEITA